MMNEVARTCWNCKHKGVTIEEEPCYSCVRKDTNANWEATTTIIKKEEETEEKTCVSCKHNSYETPCGNCGDDCEGWESIKARELTCNGCRHEGKTAYEVPCNECTRRRKDLFELPKRKVKKIYYYNSWSQGGIYSHERFVTHALLDPKKVQTPHGITKYLQHTMEIEEEE